MGNIMEELKKNLSTSIGYDLIRSYAADMAKEHTEQGIPLEEVIEEAFFFGSYVMSSNNPSKVWEKRAEKGGMVAKSWGTSKKAWKVLEDLRDKKKQDKQPS